MLIFEQEKWIASLSRLKNIQQQKNLSPQSPRLVSHACHDYFQLLLWEDFFLPTSVGSVSQHEELLKEALSDDKIDMQYFYLIVKLHISWQ